MYSFVILTALTAMGQTCPSGTCPNQAYRTAQAPAAAPAVAYRPAPATYYPRGYTQAAPAPAIYAPAPAPVQYAAPAPAYAPTRTYFRAASSCPNGACSRR